MESLSSWRRFFAELKRRNVYRVAVAYLAVAFVGFQAASLLVPSTVLPSWTDEFFLFLLIVGFPVALVVAWAFELTPDGVRRTRAGEAEGPATGDEGGWSLTGRVLAGLGLLAAGVAGWQLAAGGEGGVTDRSIAVLPFEELGAAEPGVFTEGLHDDLLTRLSNISGLTVISRTAVRRYRETAMTTGEIARELGVRWVLEGGVQEMGEQIQVNAQLIDPRTEAHVWADSYRRDLSARSLFQLQSEITKRIAGALETRLTAAEAARVERVPTENLAAYRFYVQGRTHLDTRTEAGMRRALEEFRRALEEDSAYALAWSGLADARGLLVLYGHAPRDSLLPGALDAARRALALDPGLAEGHASLGLVLGQMGEQLRGLREYRRAVELKPSYARAIYWYGVQLKDMGRHEAAREPLLKAVELDPRSPVYHNGLAGWYLAADSLERALEEARKHDEYGDQPAGPSKPGKVLSLMGRHEEALASLRRAVERTEPGSLAHVWARLQLALAHVRAGQPERGRELLAAVGDEERRYPGAGLNTAEIFAALGELDSAFAYLATAQPNPGSLHDRRAFDSLRQDPRWETLVREVRQAWGLNPDGSLPEGAMD